MNPATLDLSTLPMLALESRRDLPTAPGIYFVRNTSGEVIYIGRTVNLAQRWTSHHRIHQISKLPGSTIAWLIVEDIEMLSAIEAACIAHYRPTMNESTIEYSEDQMPMRSFRVPNDLWEQFKVYAKKEHRSINGQLRVVMEEALRKYNA